MRCVLPVDAEAYCVWCDAELPTEREFVRLLCRERVTGYPWGAEPVPPAMSGNYADEDHKRKYPAAPWPVIEGYRDGYEDVAPVGAFRADGYGLFDLSGNVAEICKAEGGGYVAKGGAWYGHWEVLKCDDRMNVYCQDSIGFRCVKRLSR